MKTISKQVSMKAENVPGGGNPKAVKDAYWKDETMHVKVLMRFQT